MKERTDERTDGRTDGRQEGRKEGKTDERLMLSAKKLYSVSGKRLHIMGFIRNGIDVRDMMTRGRYLVLL